MSQQKTMIVERVLGDGSIGRLGTIRLNDEGYRFIPAVGNHKPSRRVHPSLEACLPKWVGYPDRCRVR